MTSLTVWLCRRCGAFFTGENSELDPESELLRRINAPTKAARISTHDCGGGAFGMADLAGVIPQQEVDPR